MSFVGKVVEILVCEPKSVDLQYRIDTRGRRESSPGRPSMSFSLFFAILTVLCMVYFLVLTRRSALRRLFVIAFFGSGLALILNPDWANEIAHWAGVGRGADLVLYLSTLFLFLLAFNIYLRVLKMEDTLGLIVREMALRHPVREEGRGSASRRAGPARSARSEQGRLPTGPETS